MKNILQTLHRKQNGNAIWIILLTIGLFGILGAVITRTSSSVNQTGSTESNRVKAAALLRYAKSVETAVQTMILNGVSESDLDFVGMTSHDNTNCSDSTCEVFNIEGGGVDYQTPAEILDNDDILEWRITSHNRVYQFGCDDANNSCTELIMIAYSLPKSLCMQINRIQGITNTDNDAPQLIDIIEGDEFTGTYSTTINSYYIGGTNAGVEGTELQGKTAGCFYEYSVGQDKYHFYQILVTR